jgi:hypothetical protein
MQIEYLRPTQGNEGGAMLKSRAVQLLVGPIRVHFAAKTWVSNSKIPFPGKTSPLFARICPSSRLTADQAVFISIN